MKNTWKFIALFSFVFIMASCEKDREIYVEKDTENSSNFKDEQDDPLTLYVPTIHGHIFITSDQRALGVVIILMGTDNNYFDSTSPDINGGFVFYNVGVGTYERKTIIGGLTTGTRDYIVTE